MNQDIKTFKKATSKEFKKMSVQERKEYLDRFYTFIGRDRSAESATQEKFRGNTE